MEVVTSSSGVQCPGESNTIRIENSLVQMHIYLATVYGDMIAAVYVDSEVV